MSNVDTFLLHQWQVRHHHQNCHKQGDLKPETTKSFESPVQSRNMEIQSSKVKAGFRLKAKIVAHIVGLCQVSRKNVLASLSTEPWYINLDIQEDTSNEPQTDVTFTQDETKEIFHFSYYKRKHRKGSGLEEEVRRSLSKPAEQRTSHQNAEVMCNIRDVCKAFNNFPLSVQQKVIQLAWYDKYKGNTVVVKTGNRPDGIYFILSGSLIQKEALKRRTNDVIAGAVVGENELICGRQRQSTIVTRTTTDVLYLHWQDYNSIFEMADDLKDIKLLDIAKQHTVFQHFPTQKLEECPENWTVVKYRNGRVIAADSNNVDWIYIINSGEARVLKYLNPGQASVIERRKKIQALMKAESPFYRKHEILNFITEREYIQSSYQPHKYHPATRFVSSAPPSSQDKTIRMNSKYEHPCTAKSNLRHSKSHLSADFSINSNRKIHPTTALRLDQQNNEQVSSNEQSENDDSRQMPIVKVEEASDDDDKEVRSKINTNVEELSVEGQDHIKLGGRRSVCRKKKPNIKLHRGNGEQQTDQRPVSQHNKKVLKSFKNINSMKHPELPMYQQKLPAFVQVEVLSQGQIFGLRSCLEPDERGPSASMVSADCEVLQVDKKFFMKHCDDALIAIIKHKAKPFPSDEELIDRLDVTLKWEEYKQKILQDFFKQRSHSSR